MTASSPKSVTPVRSQRRASATNPGRFFKQDSLVVPRLADAIRSISPVRLGFDGLLYRYHEGVYRADGESFVRATARSLLGDRFKRRHVEEAIAFLRAEFPSVRDSQPQAVINLRNGFLHWKSPAPELKPHGPEIVSTVQVPHRWNPTARCPRIDQFLGEVLPEDATPFVHELIGYALLTANPLRVSVLLLGPGRNGKSVLLHVIKALLGESNVSAVPLQTLAEHRFAAAELFGKLANICGDLDARSVKQTDAFKMLTGGDPMFGERKFRDPFKFTSFALPIFSANEPPLSADQTEAWFDRWLVLPMERRIPEHLVDPQLTAKLTTPEELDGLLVLAVQGLRRLTERGRFELPPSVQAARVAYRERLDSVDAFTSECCEFKPDAWIRRSGLHAAYRRWAAESGRPPVSAAAFHEHLRRNFPDRTRETARNGFWGWAGIQLIQGGLDG